MEIKIIKYIPDEKNLRKGFVDFEAIYSPNKSEIFRNCSYCQKEQTTWISSPVCNRDGKWLPTYERNGIKETFKEAHQALLEQLTSKPEEDEQIDFSEDLPF